ncbi:MAG: hypothetical protein MZU84_05970 [Sphingobacterium sp.]|nr:hypothetical protein [Sphingobacterium sp.]
MTRSLRSRRLVPDAAPHPGRLRGRKPRSARYHGRGAGAEPPARDLFLGHGHRPHDHHAGGVDPLHDRRLHADRHDRDSLHGSGARRRHADPQSRRLPDRVDDLVRDLGTIHDLAPRLRSGLRPGAGHLFRGPGRRRSRRRRRGRRSAIRPTARRRRPRPGRFTRVPCPSPGRWSSRPSPIRPAGRRPSSPRANT